MALIESYLKAGMKGEGEREIQAVLKAPGVTPEDQIKLAGVLLEDKQPDIAQEVLEQAVRSAPDSAEVHARLGALLINKNQYEDAAKEAGRAVQLAPESAFRIIDNRTGAIVARGDVVPREVLDPAHENPAVTDTMRGE